MFLKRGSVTGVRLPYISRCRVARSSKFVLTLMQVGLGQVEFVPARESIEDRHLHRKKGAKGRPRAAELVRFGDADLQAGSEKMRVQRDLRIVLGADLQNPLFLGTDIGKLRDQIRPLGQNFSDSFT